MDGMLTSSMVDLSDPAALAAAFAEGAPMAEMAVDAWLPTIDPSTIAAADIIPRYECTEEHHCPYKTQCFNSGPWSSAAPYECAVVNCGSSKCTLCPDWFPPMLKSLVFVSWCSYLCAVRLPPRVIVAQGAVGITSLGKVLPSTGAWCFDP